MGWSGEGIMDGDRICEIYCAILKKCKVNFDDYDYDYSVQLKIEDKNKVIKKSLKVVEQFKKMPSHFGVYDEFHKGLFWQAYLNIVMKNKIPENPLLLSEYFEYHKMMMEHASTFVAREKREMFLKNFLKQSKQYIKKMEKQYYPTEDKKSVKVKVL